MGLIKAISGAVRSELADQWVDYIKCDAMSNNVLAVKGEKYVTGKSSNKKASENVISNGSRIDVADGQFMMIVENGKVVDYCAEPGQYTYETDSEPSLLGGGFKDLGKTFKEIGKRFTAGGQQTHSQYVYYINTKELMGNKWGVGEVPFRDSEFNFTIKIGAYGEYSYKITNPLLFYTNICANVEGSFTRDRIDSQLKSELQTAMQPALGRIALKKVAYDQLPLFTKDICSELDSELTAEWAERRGISIVSFAMSGVTPDADSAEKINKFQESRVYTNPNMMGARLGTAQANAMESAAQNDSGAMTGFMGMGFAQQAGGANAAQMFQMHQQQAEQYPEQNGWTCECGKVNQGKFCTECGKPQPEQKQGWVCKCGAVNQGKFCSECGAKKPEGEPLYRCDKCGWKPQDPKNPPKFCPECGDAFDENDIEK